jgi:hypothetical protein
MGSGILTTVSRTVLLRCGLGAADPLDMLRGWDWDGVFLY